MHASRTFALSLLMLGLAGTACAADQTQPGASHGPSKGQSAATRHSTAPADDATGAGQTGVGGTANGTNAAGKGTTTGSGGMQPRLNGGNANGSTRPATGNAGAQGM
ncbi:hypothetical protein QCE63_14825 [Caballeronia sp. LZ065]|uniref:hypothetical protein n=1 Tax=Caballeronia sp. LZ065 TaxID=3038571 RepID=UPI0028671AA2|nr:hypothetical protein [Caballeronia sp. LZ065]MDR5780694.1 hypothetical protein [Caballeronia sp. LZ065]